MKFLIPILLFTFFMGTETALGQFITEPRMDFTKGSCTSAEVNEIYKAIEKWDKGLSELYKMLGMERKRYIPKGYCVSAELIKPHENQLNENLFFIWEEILTALETMAEKPEPPKEFSQLKPTGSQQILLINPDPAIAPMWIYPKDLFMNCFICGKHVAADEDNCFRTDYWGRVVLVHPVCIKKSHEENAK